MFGWAVVLPHIKDRLLPLRDAAQKLAKYARSIRINIMLRARWRRWLLLGARDPRRDYLNTMRKGNINVLLMYVRVC